MRKLAVIALLSFATAAQAQFFTPSEVVWLDFRYINTNEFSAFLNSITNVTADTTTITNNGSGQFSVKNYDTNAAAILFYAINNRKTWDDMKYGVRSATWDEMKDSPFAATWDDMK